MTDTFDVEFTHTPADLLALGRYWTRTDPMVRRRLLMIVVLVALISLLFALIIGDVVILLIGLVVTGAGYFGVRAFWARQHLTMAQAADPDRFTRPVHFRLTPEAIEATTSLSSTRIERDAVADVGVTADHVFFRVTNPAYVAVPRRAFASDDEWSRFVAAATQLKASNT